MKRITIIQAPSALGVSPNGIQEGGDALLDAGLAERIGARAGARAEPAPFDTRRDAATGMLNLRAISDHAAALAGAVEEVLATGRFPLVLGGDCSILLGPLLALQRRGRHGLFFLDGHMDFYQPDAEPRGEAASMELALVTGRGPDLVTRIGGRIPLVRDEDVAVLGFRDEAEAMQHGSQPLPPTLHAAGLRDLRRDGIRPRVQAALAHLDRPELHGFWLHLDVDVLSHDLLPAADFPIPGGLNWQELRDILDLALASGRAVGMQVTIYNPRLDPDASQAARLVDLLAAALDGSATVRPVRA